MIRRTSVFVAALGALLACPFASAQVRSGVSSAAAPSIRAMPAPAAAAGRPAASRTVSARHISGRTRTNAGPASFVSLFPLDNTSGVPGLGFDFPHLAAISGERDRTPFPHVRRHEHNNDGFFVPILFGGVPFYYDASVEQAEQEPAQAAETQRQGTVVEQPASAQPSDATARDVRNSSDSTAETQAAAPVRDVGDFILVRRDGRILFASLFSVVGAQLQYVTPEGIRRALAMSDVDADATEQMNAARGTTVQLRQ